MSQGPTMGDIAFSQANTIKRRVDNLENAVCALLKILRQNGIDVPEELGDLVKAADSSGET